MFEHVVKFFDAMFHHKALFQWATGESVDEMEFIEVANMNNFIAECQQY